MMNIRILAICSVLLLAACASAAGIYGRTDALKGKPVNDAVILLGQPTGQYTSGDTTTYVWQRRASSSVLDNFTDGAVTRGRGVQIGGSISDMSPFYLQGVSYYRCTIKAVTQNGIITRIWTEENAGGCRYIYDQSDKSALGLEALR